jgi:Zn-dependent peptidase ImmA (M78 family)
MPETNRFVQSRDRVDIADLAEMVRAIFQLGDSRVNMLSLLELALPDILEDYEFLIVPDADMPGAEGLTDLKEPIIRVPDSVYAALERNEGRARFTAAHELGHLLMHSNSHVHYARSDYTDQSLDPEWQADTFAAEFLMPERVFRQMTYVEEAMSRFGVSYTAARRRALVLGHRLRRHGYQKRKGSTRQ